MGKENISVCVEFLANGKYTQCVRFRWTIFSSLGQVSIGYFPLDFICLFQFYAYIGCVLPRFAYAQIHNKLVRTKTLNMSTIKGTSCNIKKIWLGTVCIVKITLSYV